MDLDITELLSFSVSNGASDLHLSSGLPPMIRVDGDMRKLELPPLEHKDVYKLEVSTAQGPIVRNVRHFKSKLVTALAAINAE